MYTHISIRMHIYAHACMMCTSMHGAIQIKHKRERASERESERESARARERERTWIDGELSEGYGELRKHAPSQKRLHMLN
jgi:hypothetical protein